MWGNNSKLKLRRAERDQSRVEGMILEDKLKACQRLKKNLSEQLSRTGENMWAIIDQYKEKLSLAATYEQRLEDEYAKCRNLPFGGRAMRGPWVRLPRGENARSRHHC